MTSPISRLSAAITRTPTPWTRPEFSMPMEIQAADLEQIGVDRAGRRWFWNKSRRQWGQLVEQRQRLDTDPNTVLPSSPMFLEPGPDGMMWTVLSANAPGSFERLMQRRQPRPPAPTLPVDRLGFVSLADPKGTWALPGTGLTPAVPAVRGAEQIRARIRKAGADVVLSADRASLVVLAPGGRPSAGVVELAKEAEPLLIAFLAGTPLVCRVTAHKGKPAEAITLTGSTPWCGECVPDVKR